MSELVNCPQLSVAQFFGIENGTRVFNHNADECVALTNQYHEGTIGGSFVPVSAAFQWFTQFDQLPQLNSLYNKVELPKRGDIFVALGGIYDQKFGHIGVVERDWDGSTFGTMEQNAGSGAARWVWRYNRNLSNILGFIRPKANIGISKDQEMYLVRTTDGRGLLIREYDIQHVQDPGEFDTLGRILASNPKDPDTFVSNQIDSISKYLTAPKVSVDLSGVQVNVDALAQAIADKINGGSSVDITTKSDILDAITANYPEDK